MPRSNESAKILVKVSVASLVCAFLFACAGDDSNLAETTESGKGSGVGGRSVTAGMSGGASATGAVSANVGGTGALSGRSAAAGGQSATGQGRGGASTNQSSGGTPSGAGGTSNSTTIAVGGTANAKGGTTGSGGANFGGEVPRSTTSASGGASSTSVVPAPTWNALWANYFKPRCGSCHTSAASAAQFCSFLTNIQQLDGTSQPPLTSATGSVLSWFNESGYMPKDNAPVPAKAVEDIRAWANAGAVCP